MDRRPGQARQGCGWKGPGRRASNTFVLNACAVTWPGGSRGDQALIPQAPKYRSVGLDLTSEECSSLMAYVREPAPAPTNEQPFGDDEAKVAERPARATFAGVGCAGLPFTHVGDFRGIYCDLLLHDMGRLQTTAH